MHLSILSQINWVAVIIAAIGYYAMGALWYSQAFFGLKWARLRGINIEEDAEKKIIGTRIVSSFIFMVITCTALALLIVRMDLFIFRSALIVGTLGGLGFAGMAIAGSLLYQRKPLALYLIECGHHLAANIIAAVILVLWR